MELLMGLASSFSIGGKQVGAGAPSYIIAEAGSNHDRDLKQAFRLIDVAFEAGADAIKFQTFSAETIVCQGDHPLTKIDFAGAKSLFELFKGIELPREWQKELSDYAKSKGIEFLSTPFDEQAVDELYDIGVNAFKIASFELTHYPLLRHVAQTGKPVLLSTGMARIEEVAEAVAVLEDAGCREVGLFHCGIGYPMNPKEVNLRAMNTMAERFNCPVGYSDHTSGIAITTAAAALGASILEKHFTLDNALPGPDHAFALEPSELAAMIDSVRLAEEGLGSEEKGPAASELEYRQRGFRSMFSKRAILKGEAIGEDMIAVLRPAAGLHPRHLGDVVKKRAARDIGQYRPLQWEDFE